VDAFVASAVPLSIAPKGYSPYRGRGCDEGERADPFRNGAPSHVAPRNGNENEEHEGYEQQAYNAPERLHAKSVEPGDLSVEWWRDAWPVMECVRPALWLRVVVTVFGALVVGVIAYWAVATGGTVGGYALALGVSAWALGMVWWAWHTSVTLLDHELVNENGLRTRRVRYADIAAVEKRVVRYWVAVLVLTDGHEVLLSSVTLDIDSLVEKVRGRLETP
jgi:hypothetical protein